MGFLLGKKRRRSFHEIVLGRLFWDENEQAFCLGWIQIPFVSNAM